MCHCARERVLASVQRSYVSVRVRNVEREHTNEHRSMMDVTQTLTDSLVLVEGLYDIASDSEDADTVRMAMGALQRTEAGRMYLEQNPIII